VPPLRERIDDIPILAEYFLKEFCAAHGRALRTLSPEGVRVLQAYSWPGNVRELKNLTERMIILTTESEEGRAISAADVLRNMHDDAFVLRMEDEGLVSIPERPSDACATATKNLRDARQGFEKEFIIKTLKEHDWNVSRAAQTLGIERSHLHRKIKLFGIEGSA